MCVVCGEEEEEGVGGWVGGREGVGGWVGVGGGVGWWWGGREDRGERGEEGGGGGRGERREGERGRGRGGGRSVVHECLSTRAHACNDLPKWASASPFG